MATTNQKEQFEETDIYSANTAEALEMPEALESIGDPEKGRNIIDTGNGVDADLVTWDGEDDPNDPYNWSQAFRLLTTLSLSCGGLVNTMSTNYVFAPFIIAPFSEMYGRRPAYLICHAFYILFNSLCPVGKSKSVMTACRFLSGLGGACGITLSGPSMADIWRIDRRGRAISLVSLATYCGAAVGPIVGGLVSQNVGWPWTFWVVSIFDAVLLIFYSLVLRESYAPVLLAKKAKHLRKTTGRNYQTKFERMHPTFRKKIGVSVVRPLKLLVTRPIIQFISILLAYNFGVYVIALSTFSAIYSTRYHESETAGGLHYIAIAVGSTIATQLGGPLMDCVWAHLKRKSGNVVPEFRVPLMIPGAVMMPAGLFIYGWAAEKEVAWIVVDIGAAIFSGGVQIGSNAMFAYLIDEFGEHSASANAGARVLSMAMGFGFPLFAPQLYETLGYGWGNSLLAFLYIATGIPAPFLLWKWGAKIRAIGRPK